MIESRQQHINILSPKANQYSNKYHFLLNQYAKTMKIGVICYEKKDYHYLCGQ